jgi:type I restriction enzyme M protein
LSSPQQLVQKLWNYCNILRDDGLSYDDYVEHLTYLLFLKMADEQCRPPYSKPSPVPAGFGWDVLEDSASLPALEVIAAEIIEDLQAALEQLALITEMCA